MNLDRATRLLVIVLSGLFGFALFAFPDAMAAAFGLAGTDEFAYRAGGAAFLGYAVAFAAGWSASASSLRILWISAYGAAVATVIAAAIRVTSYSALPTLALLVGAAIAAALTGYAMTRSRPMIPAPTGRRFSTWFVLFLGWGVIASALFGLGGLVLGATFGSLVGFPGGDDLVYRLAGAATIGILVASLLALRTQDWDQVRLPVHLSFATNVLTLIGGLVYISGGGVPLVTYVIAAAAVFNICGLGLALTGRR